MGLTKQAKVLNKPNADLVLAFLSAGRNSTRNQLIFLLSVKAGLRAKEIAALRWSMVLTPDGQLADHIALDNTASKGMSGRVIPIAKQLAVALAEQLRSLGDVPVSQLASASVITTARAKATSAQMIVNLFSTWYRLVGLSGCSSHSGRRTFITNAARKISTVGGSLRDVQSLAGHASLQTTQRYIEGSSEAKRRIVDLV